MNIWTDTTKPYSSRNKVYTMLTYFSYRQTILYLYLYFTYTLLILYLSIIYLYLYFTYSYTYTLWGAKYTPGWRTSLIFRRSCPQSSSIIYIHHPEVYLDNISVSEENLGKRNPCSESKTQCSWKYVVQLFRNCQLIIMVGKNKIFCFQNNLRISQKWLEKCLEILLGISEKWFLIAGGFSLEKICIFQDKKRSNVRKMRCFLQSVYIFVQL